MHENVKRAIEDAFTYEISGCGWKQFRLGIKNETSKGG